MKNRMLSLILICALGIAGCGSSESATTSETATTTAANASAAHNVVGAGVSSTDSSITDATYDASGVGAVTSIDGEAVSSDASSSDTTAAPDTSATENVTSSSTDTGDSGTTESVTSSSNTVTSGNEITEDASTGNEKAANCLASLDRITWESGITSFGGYTPSQAMLQTLQDTVSEVEDNGKNISFMMIDLNTYAGICYNSEANFYASNAAIPAFIIGTINGDSTAVSTSGEEFQIIATNGDSSTYSTLMNLYGFTYMNEWMTDAGTDATADGNGSCFLSAEELTRIWLRNYQYFTAASDGSTVETWFRSPENSQFQEILGNSYTTESEPGFLSDEEMTDYNTSCEGGIVYDGENPYVLVVMTDYADNPDKIKPAISALNAAHNELMRCAGLD